MTEMTVAVRNAVDLPDTQLLGYITFLTIEDVKIHKEQLGDLFTQYGLSHEFLPTEIKPHDAFRRATAKATRTLELPGGQTARLLAREVLSDNKRVVRHLVREIVDSKNEVLDYATVGKFIYQREAEAMNVSWDGAYLSEYDYRTILTEIKDLFDEWTQYHTKDTVRNIVNKVVASTNPVSIQKNGRGVFIPKGARDTVYALKNVVEHLPSENPSFVETIPLVDTVDMRNMIARRAEEHLKDEIRDVYSDFQGLIDKHDKVSEEQMSRYLRKFVDLQQKTEEYQTLVQKGLEVVANRVRVAMDLVRDSTEHPEEAHV